MSIVDYSSLQTSIAGWLRRNNLTAQIPDFITLAEARFNTLLNRIPQQQAPVYQVTPTVSSPFIQLPTDFNCMKAVTYNNIPLNFISYESADPRNENYTFYWYTITGTNLWMQTKIDGSSVLKIIYFSKIEGLSDANTSNWLLEDAPNIYLYGALLEAAPFLGDDPRIQVWGNLLQDAIENLKANGKQNQTGGGKLQSRTKTLW